MSVERDTAFAHAVRAAVPALAHAELLETFGSFILSSSGWRAVFSQDPAAPERAGAATDNIVAVAAHAFGELLETAEAKSVVIATDTRPTGPRIAAVAARLLLFLGFDVRYAGIAATPELLAYVRQSSEIDAFFLVTASHNPIEYNGIKLGLGDGSVLDPERARKLGKRFRELMKEPDSVARARDGANSVDDDRLRALVDGSASVKQAVYDAYLHELKRIVTGIAEPEQRNAVWAELRRRVSESAPGVVVDYNGGARTRSVDRELLTELGVKLHEMNAAAGIVVHQIVPEGAGLEPCLSAVRDLHEQDGAFTLGYVTDNDGDRANIVVFDDREDIIRSVHAQELFALVCMSELAWLDHSGQIDYDENGRCRQKVAVVANGPTSLRVDRIAAAFDASVFRAEVGEANVVALARSLRRRGYVVRVLGEGSNGGSIIEPAEVRDPLATLGSILKVLFTPEPTSGVAADLFQLWCKRLGQPDRYSAGYNLGSVIATLPPFQTTGAYEERAKIDIGALQQAELKREYIRLVPAAWGSLCARLGDRMPLYRWDIVQYHGTDEVRGADKLNHLSEAGGGLKLILKNEQGRHVGFAWMRGSGTEPVFRILADTEGADEESERILLSWHSDLVKQAVSNLTAT